MSLMFEPLRKYASFTGRARRLEYWLFQLFIALVVGALLIWIGWVLPPGPDTDAQSWFADAVASTPAARLPATLLGLTGLFFFLPTLAVSVRRLHDSNKSGWWVLLGLTGLGSLILMILYLIDGTNGPNRFGPDPKGRAGPAG